MYASKHLHEFKVSINDNAYQLLQLTICLYMSCATTIYLLINFNSNSIESNNDTLQVYQLVV